MDVTVDDSKPEGSDFQLYKDLEEFTRNVIKNASNPSVIAEMAAKFGTKIEASILAEIATSSINNGKATKPMDDHNEATCSKYLNCNNDHTGTEITLKRKVNAHDEDKEVDERKKVKKAVKSKTVKCPFCGKDQTNLKGHAMRKHDLTEEDAKGLKSQFGLYSNNGPRKADGQRKTKCRSYTTRSCPVVGCSKVLVRMEGHLQNTHGLSGEVYKTLLKEALPFKSFEEDEDTSSSSDSESESESESEYSVFRDILRKEKKYIKAVEGIPVDSENSDDDDWFCGRVHKYHSKKEERQISREKISDALHQSMEKDIIDPSSSRHDQPSSSQHVKPSSSRNGLLENSDNNRQSGNVGPSSSQHVKPSSSLHGLLENSENNRQSGNVGPSSSQHVKPSSSRHGLLENSDNNRQSGNVGSVPYNSDYSSCEEDLNNNEMDQFTDVTDSKRVDRADESGYSSVEDDEDDDAELLIVPWKLSLLDEFKTFLEGPDGGLKSKRQGEQHKNQVQVVLKDSSKQTFNFKELFDRQKIRDNWLVPFAVERKPGTVKSYLYSLRFFYKFVQTERPKLVLKHLDRCLELINTMDSWISTYRKKQKANQWKVELKQFQEMITAEDMHKFDNSEHVKRCKKGLKQASKSEKKVSMKLFTNSRDFILISLCLDNAQRSGAMGNMTLNEFNKGTVHEDGIYKVSVVNHKTLDSNGPANLVFTPELYHETENYVKYMRNSLDGISKTKECPVFVSWSGNKMSSSMVTTQMKSFWGKSVGFTERNPNFSATKARKFAVTKTHKNKPEMKFKLAELMSHSEKTAAKVYRLSEKNVNAVETSTSLRKLMREIPSDDNDNLKKCFENCFDKKRATLALIREARDNLPEDLSKHSDHELRDKVAALIREEQEKEKKNPEEEEEEQEQEEEEEQMTDRVSRKDFHKEHKSLIVKTFADIIFSETKVLVKESEIEKKLKSCEHLKKTLLDGYGAHRITEKVRTERKKFFKSKK
eukprot:TCONS_00064402-protein